MKLRLESVMRGRGKSRHHGIVKFGGAGFPGQYPGQATMNRLIDPDMPRTEHTGKGQEP